MSEHANHVLLQLIEWKSFNIDLSLKLFEYRQKKYLTDCFLIAEGKSLPCHRIILSAMSPFFNNLMSAQVENHPMIVLNDNVTFQDAEDILQYVYTGKCVVSNERLSTFVEIGRKLQISGFPVPASERIEAASDGRDVSVHTTFPARKRRLTLHSKSPKRGKGKRRSSVSVVEVKTRPKSSSKSPKISKPNPNRDPKPQKEPKQKKKFSCEFCLRQYTSKCYIKFHQQTCPDNQEKKLKTCEQCSKKLSPSAMVRHKKLACKEPRALPKLEGNNESAQDL